MFDPRQAARDGPAPSGACRARCRGTRCERKSDKLLREGFFEAAYELGQRVFGQMIDARCRGSTAAGREASAKRIGAGRRGSRSTYAHDKAALRISRQDGVRQVGRAIGELVPEVLVGVTID